MWEFSWETSKDPHHTSTLITVASSFTIQSRHATEIIWLVVFDNLSLHLILLKLC